jgi:hypothetical protein
MTEPKNPSHPLYEPEFASKFFKVAVKTMGLLAALAKLDTLTRKHPEDNHLVDIALAMGVEAPLKAFASAEAFWKELVEAVGEFQAKQIMQSVMGEKKTGRSGDPMTMLVYASISIWGLVESDEKIAKRIIESKPHYVESASGKSGVVNEWMTEESIVGDEIIIKRTPINKSLPAMKKHVGRVRQWLIEEKILPKEYAPKPYYPG